MSFRSFARSHLPFLLPVFAAQLALAAAPVRYKEASFRELITTSDIPFGSAVDAAGITETLLLDVYQPALDTAQARPLIIFVHGGGFSIGSKTDGEIVFLCRNFAQKGYVTASFNYRMQSPIPTYHDMALEVLRALQDGKAAVRYLRAHRKEFGIDDTKILMGGTSAGGVLSLHYVFLDNTELAAYADTSVSGGVEGHSGTPGVPSGINGVINCWGGVADSTILYSGNKPVISFHGTADPTVPYDVGYSLGNPALITFGSACVHRVLTRIGVPSILKTFPGMGHGFPSWADDPRADTLVAMTTTFAYDVFFAGRAAVAPGSVAGADAHAPGAVRGPFLRNTLAGDQAFPSGATRSLDGRRASPGMQRDAIMVETLRP